MTLNVILLLVELKSTYALLLRSKIFIKHKYDYFSSITGKKSNQMRHPLFVVPWHKLQQISSPHVNHHASNVPHWKLAMLLAGFAMPLMLNALVTVNVKHQHLFNLKKEWTDNLPFFVVKLGEPATFLKMFHLKP